MKKKPKRFENADNSYCKNCDCYNFENRFFLRFFVCPLEAFKVRCRACGALMRRLAVFDAALSAKISVSTPVTQIPQYLDYS